MEETKPVKTGAGESLSEEQAASIAGGDGSCTSTATVGTTTTVTGSGATPADALISIYEGFVDLTSHVIERIVAR
jgi:hypothetical protein